MNKKIINNITLISSGVCNLDCNFCFLYKNQSFQTFNDEIQKAWKEKTYITNVVQALDKLNIDFNLISTIQLWGGEPLLYIYNLIPSIKEIYQNFPNIDNIWTSSNFTFNIDHFINFLLELDHNCIKKSIFRLQLSIDGPEGDITNQGHNVSWDIYKKQFTKLIQNLNNIKFNKLQLQIYIKSTMEEQYYLNYFNDMNNIISYYQQMLELKQFVINQINNNNVIWQEPIQFPAPSLPSSASVEDGLIYSKIAQSWNYLKINKFKDSPIELYRGIGRIDNNYNLTYANYECGEMKAGLTFWPDGTIMLCGSTFMLPNKEYQKELEKDQLLDELFTAKINTNLSFNFLNNDAEKNLENYNWYVLNGLRNNYSTYYNLMLGMCQELALSGQISKKYINKEIALKHISLILPYISCTRECIKTTKIPFLCQPSTFRKFFNGLINYIEENQMIKNEKEDYI